MKRIVFSAIAALCISASYAQTNYDESKVPAYTLPDPLKTKNGKRITDKTAWEKEQRPAILQLFAEHVYGKMPGEPSGVRYAVTDIDSNALGGKAIRKQVTIHFSQDASLDLLIYLPKTSKKVPMFVGLNFEGNHSVSAEKEIQPAKHWKKQHPDDQFDALRGSQSRRWPVEMIIGRGYGLVTAHYYDLEVDNGEGWKEGIRSTMKTALATEPEEWSAIGAWAWGLSRIQDYLETEPGIDAGKTIITGHSRLGKAALWAAANDQRFSRVIANNSGEGGAALSRRWYGETIRDLNTTFPHWFVAKYKSYNDNAHAMPVDQHMLLALMAPRPLYIASAEEDRWADPKGELLSAFNAAPVYRLYGIKITGLGKMPELNKPVGNKVRYHIRTGKHDIIAYDWQQYLDFADATAPTS